MTKDKSPKLMYQKLKDKSFRCKPFALTSSLCLSINCVFNKFVTIEGDRTPTCCISSKERKNLEATLIKKFPTILLRKESK